MNRKADAPLAITWEAIMIVVAAFIIIIMAFAIYKIVHFFKDSEDREIMYAKSQYQELLWDIDGLENGKSNELLLMMQKDSFAIFGFAASTPQVVACTIPSMKSRGIDPIIYNIYKPNECSSKACLCLCNLQGSTCNPVQCTAFEHIDFQGPGYCLGGVVPGVGFPVTIKVSKNHDVVSISP